jgi:signal transduction histidine kinase
MSDPRRVARLPAVKSDRSLGAPETEGEVLLTLISNFGADEGRIYFLDLATGDYTSTYHSRKPSPPVHISGRKRRQSASFGLLEEAIGSLCPVVSLRPSAWEDDSGREHVYGPRVVVPVIRRETSVVALIDLRAKSAEALDDPFGSLQESEAVIQQVANLHESRLVHRILRHAASIRVALAPHETSVVSNMLDFLHESSAMQYVAVRKLYGENLRCIGARGFAEKDTTKFNMKDLEEEYPTFYYAVHTREHWVSNNMHGEENRKLRESDHLKDVASYVACPMLVGDELWGVVSFGAAVEYEYSELEVFALRALANLAGTSLDASALTDGVAESVYDDARLNQAILSNEVVAASRHSLDNHVAQLNHASVQLGQTLRTLDHNRRLSKKERDQFAHTVGAVGASGAQIAKTLETIRFSQGELDSSIGPVSLRSAFEAAVYPFSFGLRRRGIDMQVDIPLRIVISGSSDYVRVVFVHLIVNALDAFDRRITPKSARQILVRINEDSADRIVLRFADNAGGIGQAPMRRRGSLVEGDPTATMFERFTTSKEDGSGLGLASSRTMLTYMGGSIDVVDSRRGLVFDLTFMRWKSA